MKQMHICGDQSKWFIDKVLYIDRAKKEYRHKSFPSCCPYTLIFHYWSKLEYLALTNHDLLLLAVLALRCFDSENRYTKLFLLVPCSWYPIYVQITKIRDPPIRDNWGTYEFEESVVMMREECYDERSVYAVSIQKASCHLAKIACSCRRCRLSRQRRMRKCLKERRRTRSRLIS